MILFNKKSFGFVTLMLLGASAYAMDFKGALVSATNMPKVAYLPRVIGDAELPINGNTLVAAFGGFLVAKTLYDIAQRRQLAMPKVEVHNTANDTRAELGVTIADVKIPLVYVPKDKDGKPVSLVNAGVVHPALTLRNALLAYLGAKGTACIWNYTAQMFAGKK